MASRFAPLLVLVFVLILPGPSLAFLINGRPTVVRWSLFHNPKKSPDIDCGDALIDFLTEDIKEETIFTMRIAEIIDSKNESFLALVALFSLLFLARLHKNGNQTRPSSLDTDDLARLQILKDTGVGF